jgi:hypothetical protein
VLVACDIVDKITQIAAKYEYLDKQEGMEEMYQEY